MNALVALTAARIVVRAGSVLVAVGGIGAFVAAGRRPRASERPVGDRVRRPPERPD